MNIKKIIIGLSVLISFSSMAQISLDAERNRDTHKQEVQDNSPENNSLNNIGDLNPSSEEAQKQKFANMSQLLLMNAAVVGYGQACNFSSDSIQEIKEFLIKRYEIQNERYILNKYEEKINEFKNSNPKADECNIFRKEFNSILKNVREYK